MLQLEDPFQLLYTRILDLRFDDEAIHKRAEYNNFGCLYVAYLIVLEVITFMMTVHTNIDS